MIFVTTGTQLPFPRLIKTMTLAAEELGERVVAQVGPDKTPYPNLECIHQLNPAEFKALFNEARVIVAHAGIGTMLSAKAAQKPLIIFPRRHALAEHRNDHQLATAKQVVKIPGIYVAWTDAELVDFLKQDKLMPAKTDLGPHADALLHRLKSFIDA